MSLLNMLEDFQTANDLRLMADKLEIVGKLSKEEIDWIRSKADWIDPIVSSTDELLGIGFIKNGEMVEQVSMKEIRRENIDLEEYFMSHFLNEIKNYEVD